MAGKGGAILGAGRKSKAEELKIVNQAVNAITETYGSLEEGFKALLKTGEPSLIKWVFEHAAGSNSVKAFIERLIIDHVLNTKVK